MSLDSRSISPEEFNEFENTLQGLKLPEDYKKHMITCNGGIVDQGENEHKDYIGEGIGIASFLPIKYGNYTLENAQTNFTDRLPIGFIPIGHTTGNAGLLIMSLNNDATYGHIKVRFADGDIEDEDGGLEQGQPRQLLDQIALGDDHVEPGHHQEHHHPVVEQPGPVGHPRILSWTGWSVRLRRYRARRNDA